MQVFDPRNPYGVPTGPAHYIVVDRSQYKLYYMEHGILKKVFDCVLGRPSLPTPLGHFRIYAKDPHMGGPYGPRRMRYLGEYAIHGTDEPWLLGRYPAQLLARLHAPLQRAHPLAVLAGDRGHAGLERAVRA